MVDSAISTCLRFLTNYLVSTSVLLPPSLDTTWLTLFFAPFLYYDG